MLKNKPGLYFNGFVIILFGVLLYAGTVLPPAEEVEEEGEKGDLISTEVDPNKPFNIILMIGDGMGISQITAGYYGNGSTLNLEQFNSIGLIKTNSATDIITDSAAGATAFATGKKTRNGMISMTPDSLELKSILDYCEENGMASGLVVTSTITHATPACFYGNQTQRYSVNEQLVSQLMNHDIEVFMGGGKAYFDNRADGINYLDTLVARGYAVFDSIQQVDESWYTSDRMAVLISRDQPGRLAEGREGFLPRGTEVAINVLDQYEEGFFMMIEGSQIDWGGHDNDSEWIIEEMIEFDNVVGQVLEYAKEQGNTLVLVTADHETGGYSVNGGVMSERIIKHGFTTDYHTAAFVPIFAYGPGAELFQGTYQNNELFDRMMEILGYEPDSE